MFRQEIKATYRCRFCASIVSIRCARNCLLRCKIGKQNAMASVPSATLCPWPTPYLLLLFIRYVLHPFLLLPNCTNLRLPRPAPATHTHTRAYAHPSTHSCGHTPRGDKRKFGSMHIYNYFIAVNISLAWVLHNKMGIVVSGLSNRVWFCMCLCVSVCSCRVWVLYFYDAFCAHCVSYVWAAPCDVSRRRDGAGEHCSPNNVGIISFYFWST